MANILLCNLQEKKRKDSLLLMVNMLLCKLQEKKKEGFLITNG